MREQDLPIIRKNTLDIYRCVNVGPWIIHKTPEQLHAGNLRIGIETNRYAKLFPFLYVSYWADSICTAEKELFHRHGSVPYVLFEGRIEAVDPIRIVDGLEINFHRIIEKDEQGIALKASERELIRTIAGTGPDCLLYASKRREGGINYLFFESGFKKIKCEKISMQNITGKN